MKKYELVTDYKEQYKKEHKRRLETKSLCATITPEALESLKHFEQIEIVSIDADGDYILKDKNKLLEDCGLYGTTMACYKEMFKEVN